MKKILLVSSFLVFALALFAQDANKEGKPLIRWAVTNNYSKSDNGQLMINLPAQAALVCVVNHTGEAKSFALRNGTPKELPPGTYDITFWGIKIPLVVIEKGKDTRILAGILNSTVKGPWEILTAEGEKLYSASGPKKVALPVGKYIIKTKGVEIKTTINDGKTTIFSFTNY